MSFTVTGANAVFRGLFGKSDYVTLASNCFLAIGRSSTDSTAFIEYGRTLIGNFQSKDSQLISVDNGTASNDGVIYFPESQNEWGQVTHFAIYQGPASKDALFIGSLSSAVNITSGCVPIFRANQFRISFAE